MHNVYWDTLYIITIITNVTKLLSKSFLTVVALET